MEGVIASVPTLSGSSIRLDIDEQTQIGAARRQAVALAHGHALSADAVGRLAIVVTEAATNIVRHAGFGVIVLRALVAGPTPRIEVLALDKGPGIPDVERAMQDGYSTSGTAGRGLGGMKRLAEVFELHSQRGAGTALLARIGERTTSSSDAHRSASLDDRLGVVCVPLRGEAECGDAWRIVVGKQSTSVLLVDGLGHGPDAAAAAAAATHAFPLLAGESPDIVFAALNVALHETRGAALSLAVIDQAARALRFSGVGNVDGRVLTGGATEYLIPQSGIVGHGMSKLRSLDASWPADARLVMHSDGILARWRMDSYPGLMAAHPALIAGVIYRDFARDRDDATVLVLSDDAADERLR
jgi:anti-sigma regulatory factor (Ser/Thr protein kinase)